MVNALQAYRRRWTMLTTISKRHFGIQGGACLLVYVKTQLPLLSCFPLKLSFLADGLLCVRRILFWSDSILIWSCKYITSTNIAFTSSFQAFSSFRWAAEQGRKRLKRVEASLADFQAQKAGLETAIANAVKHVCHCHHTLDTHNIWLSGGDTNWAAQSFCWAAGSICA